MHSSKFKVYIHTKIENSASLILDNSRVARYISIRVQCGRISLNSTSYWEKQLGARWMCGCRCGSSLCTADGMSVTVTLGTSSCWNNTRSSSVIYRGIVVGMYTTDAAWEREREMYALVARRLNISERVRFGVTFRADNVLWSIRAWTEYRTRRL